MSDDSSDLNFICVRDGTIFTLEKHQKPTPENPTPVMVRSEWPTFGFLALAVFEQVPWKRIKALKVFFSCTWVGMKFTLFFFYFTDWSKRLRFHERSQSYISQ